MEDEIEMKVPYYETAYLDDDNVEHLVKIKDRKSLDFFEERFNVLEYHLITEMD